MPVAMLPQRAVDDGRLAELTALIVSGRGDALPDSKIEALGRFVASTPARLAPPSESASTLYGGYRPRHVAYLLELAYGRPCFLCGKGGPCGHREPGVELALLGVRNGTK
jgi:hypothetical protein